MNAIKDFQTEYGLSVDGIVGEYTLLKIKEVLSIKTNEMLAHFMGQCHVESEGFTTVSDNLNYSSQGLLGTFPKYFDHITAPMYQRNPQMIANRAYANRMGNRDEISGDGWEHRGFGLIQLTGKENQDAFSDYINDEKIKLEPSIIATKYPFESAKFYFDSNKIWSLCTSVTDESITSVSKKVNGGTNGLQARIDATNHYYKLLT